LSFGKNESVRSYALGDGSDLDTMIEDLGDGWLYQSSRKPLIYPQRRLFIYKGGCSQWHKHPLDDHLTFQIRGAKDFVLLSPDQSHKIREIWNNELHSFLVDPMKYPKWRSIRPISARLGAGDAIYIPPRWWHTVVPVDQLLGITLASVWGSSGKAILMHGLPGLFPRVSGYLPPR
jgi:quercetin dioxygenase-like cupin family protein